MCIDIDADELIELVESEVLCTEQYCPFHYKNISSPSNPNCEGRYCELAFDKYKEVSNGEM